MLTGDERRSDGTYASTGLGNTTHYRYSTKGALSSKSINTRRFNQINSPRQSENTYTLKRPGRSINLNSHTDIEPNAMSGLIKVNQWTSVQRPETQKGRAISRARLSINSSGGTYN